MTHAMTDPPPPPDYRRYVPLAIAIITAISGWLTAYAQSGDVATPTFPTVAPCSSPPAAPAGLEPHPPVIYDQDGEPANELDAP